MDNQEELFIVVDRNDNVVDYHKRYDCHHDKNLIHRAIGVMIFNDKGEILIQKRSMNKDLYPGMYTLSATGHVDKGEEYIEAAKRELSEELGIEADIKEEKKFIVESEDETEMYFLFSAKHNGPFNPSKDEVQDVIFMNMNQIKTLMNEFTPCSQEALRQSDLV